MNIIHFISVLFSIVLLAGCSITKGFRGKSDGATATVLAHGVTFQRVNDIKVGIGSSGLEVLPGENGIELTVNSSNYNSSSGAPEVFTLLLLAEAGQSYSITGPRGGGQLCAYPLKTTGDPDFQSPAGCIQRK